MPTPQEAQLKRMCSKSETLVQAQVLLNTAITRTRPGSGHELGGNAIGLPAICAFIASSELNNDDVSEKVAQTASCLAPKIFASTLATVKAALADGTSSSAKSPQKERRSSRHRPSTDYASLVREHQVKLADTVVGWLEDAERVLDSSSAFRAAHDPQSAPVKCATFYWVCQVLELTRINRDLMVTRYGILEEAFDDIVLLLDQTCSPMRKKIVKEVEELKKSSRRKGSGKKTEDTGSPTKNVLTTPRKTRGRAVEAESASTLEAISVATPKKPSLKRVNDDINVPQMDTPRRKVAFSPALSGGPADDAMEVDDALPSPSKRPRTTFSRLQENSEESLNTHLARQGSESSSVPETPSRHASLRQRGVSQSIPSVTTTKIPEKTLRRGRRTTRDPSLSPEVSAAAYESESESDGALPPPRRYRPAFMDRVQWATRDPRAEREWLAARRIAKRAEEAWGHPFERFRPLQDIPMHTGDIS